MKIVIGLASVVILILVVVLLALRYLKADDDDDFEDMPDERREPRSNSGDRDRPAAGRQAPRAGRPAGTARNAEPRRTGDRHGQRPARDYDRAAAPGPRELAGAHGSQRPADTYDDRHGGGIPKGHQDSLPEVRPRPVRGKRSEQDGNWPSTKWDQLSDVDYWAQVASDKPLTTTAQPAAQSAQSAPARPGPPRDPGTRHGQNQGSRTATAPERSAAARPGSRLPVRGARQPAPAGLAASAPRPGGFSPAPHAAVVAPPQSAPPAVPGVNLRSAARPGRDAAPPGAYTPAPVYDDDPLTSPSFPKIPASDSRSYGAVRPETPPSGSRILPPQAADATQHLPSYGSPSGQFDGYDSAGRQHAEPASGFGPPGSLPADPGGLPPYRPAPADPGRHGGRAAPPAPLSPPPSLPAGPGGYQAGYLPSAGAARPAPAPLPGAPSGNPYGSYVGSPAASYQPRSAAALPDSGLPAGYGSPGAADPVAQRGSPYPPSASYLDTSRPLPPAETPGGARLNGSGNGTSTSNGHAPGAGYPPPARYGPPAQHEPASYLPPGYLPPGYPAGRQEPAGYAGYAGSDPYGRDPYGQDPYGQYPGYGAADS